MVSANKSRTTNESSKFSGDLQDVKRLIKDKRIVALLEDKEKLMEVIKTYLSENSGERAKKIYKDFYSKIKKGQLKALEPKNKANRQIMSVLDLIEKA